MTSFQQGAREKVTQSHCLSILTLGEDGEEAHSPIKAGD